MRDRGLERVEAVVQRQQRVAPESDDHGFVLDRKHVERGALGPVGRSVTAVRVFHLATVFWLIP